jgi:GTP-binding protein
VVVLNKWDLVEKDDRTFDEYSARLRRQAPFLGFAPIVAVSAKTGLRVGRALDAAVDIARGRRRRISTGALNRVLNDATYRQPPPPVRNRRPRFFYATQASVEPPTFVLFASGADHVHFSYRRYLENRLRDAFGFGGTPLRFIIRERSKVQLEPRRRRNTAKGKAKTTRRGPSKR